MSWIAIEGVNREDLIENKIPHVINSITSPFTGDFCFFPENYLSQFIDLDTDYTKVETDREHKIMYMVKRGTDSSDHLRELSSEKSTISPVREVALLSSSTENATSPYKVQYYDSVNTREIPDETRASFKHYAEEILCIINKNIKIGIPHKKTKDAPKNTINWFYIFIWSQREGNKFPTIATSPTAWGIDIPCKDLGYCPSGEGIPIITDENYCIAELFEDCLYIHCDLCHYNSPKADRIFARILKEVCNIFVMTPEQKEQFLIDLKNKQTIANSNNFVSFLMKKNEERIKELDKIILDTNRTIEDYQREMLKYIARQRDYDKEIIGLANSNKVTNEKIRDEYNRILKISKVKTVYCTKDSIECHTKMIYINSVDYRDRKKPVIYKIGEFIIYLYLDGRVRFYNKTNKGEGPGYTMPSGFDGNSGYNRHHPHINSDGVGCLGSISSVIPKYIVDNNLSVLFTLLIQYLESVYIEDSAGRGIFWWPIVDKKEE